MRSKSAFLFCVSILTACGDKTETAKDVAPQAVASVAPPTPAPVLSPALTDNPGKLKYIGFCRGCHGQSAEGQGPFPKLAGKPAAELSAKLKDYRAGKQLGPQSGTMMPFAKTLTDTEIEQLSGYLSAL